MRFLSVTLLGLLVLCLFFCAIGTELWLDEIWSLELARQANHVLEIFYKINHDNNHILNTLQLYLWGPQFHWEYYRIAPATFGILTLLLLVLNGQYREQTAHRFVTLLLFGLSAVLLLLWTEARGYSFAIFFAYVAYLSSQRHQSSPSTLSAILTNAALLLGFLSHFSFTLFAIALGLQRIYSTFVSSKSENSAFPTALRAKKTLSVFLTLFVLPAILMIFWYFSYIKSMLIGGREASQPWLVLGQTYGGAFGILDGSWPSWLALVALVSLYVQYNRISRTRESLFFGIMGFGIPVFTLLVSPSSAAVRYFSISLFFLLLMSREVVVHWLLAPSIKHKLLAISFCLFFVLGNSAPIHDLLNFGRGQYLSNLRFILENSKHPKILLSSDHDFRNLLLVQFYKKYLSEKHRLVYLSTAAGDPTHKGIHWFIGHSTLPKSLPAPNLHSPTGQKLLLKRHSRYAYLSGMNWSLYQRVSSSP